VGSSRTVPLLIPSSRDGVGSQACLDRSLRCFSPLHEAGLRRVAPDRINSDRRCVSTDWLNAIVHPNCPP